LLSDYQSLPLPQHDYWQGSQPVSMAIEDVEGIWSAIAERDDWQPLRSKIQAVREMGIAHSGKISPHQL